MAASAAPTITERVGKMDRSLIQITWAFTGVATETDEAAGTRAAQDMLGHLTETQTATYIRHKIGKKVVPRK